MYKKRLILAALEAYAASLEALLDDDNNKLTPEAKVDYRTQLKYYRIMIIEHHRDLAQAAS